jgi:membrane protease YdiL (CAAX protease family)
VTVNLLACANCGTQPYPGATFCHHCGSPLQAAPESSAGAVPWTLGDIGKAIGLVILAIILTAIPAGLVAVILAGGEDTTKDPAALTFVLAAGAFLELALLFTAIHFTVRKYGTPLSALGLRWPVRGGFWSTLGIAIALVIGGLGVNYAYFEALSAVGIEPETDIEEIFQSPGPLITIAVLSLLFAPFMEEVFYRGFVFSGVRARWGLAWAALASGLLFGVSHIGNPAGLYLIPPVTIIGAMFACAYAYSGSIVTSLLAHFLFNSFALGAGIAEYS